MTMRGWSSVGLVLVDQHERLWTVAEAAQFLGEPADDVRWLIRRLGIPAAGLQQQTGADKRGRQPRTYRAVDLIHAFDVLSKAA